MDSIRKLYKEGRGPSSSHTMGPEAAAKRFLILCPGAHKFRTTLYGSLAATGRGHLSDVAILDVLSADRTEIIWKPETSLPFHPNGMLFEGLDQESRVIASKAYFSVGGGEIVEEDASRPAETCVYPFKTSAEILSHLGSSGISYWQYVVDCEGDEILVHLDGIRAAMMDSLARGLKCQGVLPGSLRLERKARSFYLKAGRNAPIFRKSGMISAFALAVAEENASGSRIVTAPTCGSAGVLPAVLRYFSEFHGTDDSEIAKALASAALFGNLAKSNASISGAQVGCQGEIGVACAMAAAAAAQLMGGTPGQIEYAAEMGLEHHLGLTCDPIDGLVQIPCIERNCFAALRAMDCADYSLLSDGKHRISFDEVLEVMNATGRDMNDSYKETARGGLAKISRSRQRCISP